MTSTPAEIAGQVVAALNRAGNTGDAAAYASVFAEDADFVNRFGTYFSGRAAIETRHTAIFKSFHAGTSRDLSLIKVRQLSGGEILAIVSGVWRVPAGPLAGELGSTYTLLLTNTPDGWRILSFQNTTVAPSPT